MSPKRPPTCPTLKAAVDSLEATAAKTNTLAELRAWRIAMAKKLIRPNKDKK